MPSNVVKDVGVARDAGYDPKWYLFSGRTDHTYTHRLSSGMVKVWLWGGQDRPASPDAPGGEPGTLYRVRMNRGDKLRIRVGGRPTKSGGGSTDGTWAEWLDGKLVWGGWPDGGEGVEQELTVVWGRAYGDTGPDRTRKIRWRCNGAGGATRVWLTPLGSDEEELIIVEPGAGASPDPRYTNGGGRPMDAFPQGAWGVGDFPYDRETWRPPGFLDPDPTFQEWPPGGGGNHYRYSYGWCGNVGSASAAFEELGETDPPPTAAWFGWEQDMPTFGVSVFGLSIENPQWPVSDINSPGSWTNDTRDEFGIRIDNNFHDDGVGVPPGPDEEPRAPRPAVPPKGLPSDISPPVNEQRETRFGEPGWESHGGNGEASAFGPRCPGGGGWGGGAAGNTTRRQVADAGGDGWISWVRMGQGTGKNGGRWWNTSVVETVILDPGGFSILPPWAPSYPSAPTGDRPDGWDYAWPESLAYTYVPDEDDPESNPGQWGQWFDADDPIGGPYPYLTDPDYEGYVGMGAAWVCPEELAATRRARWRVGHVGWGRNNGW